MIFPAGFFIGVLTSSPASLRAGQSRSPASSSDPPLESAKLYPESQSVDLGQNLAIFGHLGLMVEIWPRRGILSRPLMLSSLYQMAGFLLRTQAKNLGFGQTDLGLISRCEMRRAAKQPNSNPTKLKQAARKIGEELNCDDPTNVRSCGSTQNQSKIQQVQSKSRFNSQSNQAYPVQSSPIQSNPNPNSKSFQTKPDQIPDQSNSESHAIRLP
ncbi:hypothetical protein C8F01DRAFT_1236167 [Mycena amicta]|nr:hypothetical protein C8F01DRAFT_1236167 [Mycena amicta]